MNADPAGIAALLLQIPLVGAFIWFVLKQQERQHTANADTHGAWRAWLDAREDKLVEALERIGRRDAVHQDELVQLLRTQSEQLAYLTRLTLLIYTAIHPEATNRELINHLTQEKELTP